MNRTTRIAAIVTTLLTMGAAQAQASDPARASFDRMLDHVASTGVIAVPATFSAGDDPLMAAMVLPLRAGTAPAQPAWASQDAAGASFERMLAHLPATHSPARPAAQADDPLVAALVELLRESATEAGQLHRTQLAVVTR
ncbi:MAG: hypothetical protein L6Q73_14335 [Aquabacterium sp.]|nr:hypothetical protein [Aquabacterium sp.]